MRPLEQLEAILEDDLLEQLLETPDTELAPHKKDKLLRLSDHFVRGEKRAGAASRSRPQKKAKVGLADRPHLSPETRHPFKRFLKLTQGDVKLPLCIQVRLPAADFDPEKFLVDRTALGDGLILGGSISVADAFVGRYSYIIQLRTRHDSDRYRSLFSMLMVFDIVRCIWPNASGRIGHLMSRDLQDAMSDVLPALKMDPEEVRNNLNEWSILGSKLNFICEEFGPGSLLLIGEHLSNDFLRNKFRSSGEYYDEGKTHLHGLGLRLMADQTGANQMAQKIRDFLIAPFRKQVSGAAFEG